MDFLSHGIIYKNRAAKDPCIHYLFHYMGFLVVIDFCGNIILLEKKGDGWKKVKTKKANRSRDGVVFWKDMLITSANRYGNAIEFIRIPDLKTVHAIKGTRKPINLLVENDLLYAGKFPTRHDTISVFRLSKTKNGLSCDHLHSKKFISKTFWTMTCNDDFLILGTTGGTITLLEKEHLYPIATIQVIDKEVLIFSPAIPELSEHRYFYTTIKDILDSRRFSFIKRSHYRVKNCYPEKILSGEEDRETIKAYLKDFSYENGRKEIVGRLTSPKNAREKDSALLKKRDHSLKTVQQEIKAMIGHEHRKLLENK